MSDEKTFPNAAPRHLAEQEKTSLTAALRHLAEQERRTPSEHATPGELTAYHEGTLPPAIEARVQEHLAHCKLCSDLLLDLAGFADLAPPPGVPELTDAQVAEDWQALRARMEAEKKEPEPAAVVPFRPAATTEPTAPRRSPPWFAIAASLLAVVGFALSAYENKQVERLQTQIERLQTPIFVEGQTVSSEAGRTRSSQEETPKFGSGSGGLLYPELELDAPYPAYEAEIYLGEKEVVKLPGQAKGESIGIVIPPGALKPGEYRLRLYGVDQGQRTSVGEFPFHVDDP